MTFVQYHSRDASFQSKELYQNGALFIYLWTSLSLRMIVNFMHRMRYIKRGGEKNSSRIRKKYKIIGWKSRKELAQPMHKSYYRR